MKKYTIHDCDGTTFEVDRDYLRCINMRGVERIEKHFDKLHVVYKNKRLIYENVHGTWGFPVQFV